MHDLQSLFVATVQPTRLTCTVPDACGLPLSVAQIRTSLVSAFPRFGHKLTAPWVVLTSRMVGDVVAVPVVNGHKDIAIISTFEENREGNARVLWLARIVVHIGLARVLETPCANRGCICGTQDDFVYLCRECEIRLRDMGYNDALIQLKDTINWLNERTHDGDPEITRSASNSFQFRLPLAEAYAAEAMKAGSRPFEGKIILLVLHTLSDLVPFMNALAGHGASYSNIFLVVKPYPYRHRDSVCHSLEILGVNVHRSTAEQSVETICEDMLKDLVESQALVDRDLLIIEDGGYFAPMLHEPRFAGLCDKCIGVVEQTTKGIRADEKIVGLKFPILSVARSDFKARYEAPEIGRVTVQNIVRLVPDVKLSGGRALMFGFGDVGQQVAFHLNNSLNMSVSVVDVDELRVLQAKHRKDIVVEAARGIDGIHYLDCASLVVGTTGGLSITEDILRKLPDGAILASTSSDQVEIAVSAMKSMAGDNVVRVAPGRSEYVIATDPVEKRLTLLAEGYPINFYGAESVPNETIDPVMTLLLLSAAHLCSKSYEKKVDSEAVNKIAKEMRLLERFLARSRD